MTTVGVSDPEPILIAEWSLNNRGETARVTIDSYKGSWLISVRKWFKTDDGQMRPGKGIAMGAKNLPRLTAAMQQGLSIARGRGLVPADQEDSR